MKIIRSVFISLLFSVTLFGQQELTLEDAVMEQYRKFYPKFIFGFSWVPNTTAYSYLDQYTTLVKATAPGKDPETVMTIRDLNSKLGSRLYYFQGFQWKDEHSFYVHDDDNFYHYNLNTQKGEKIELPAKAANKELHLTSGHLAYTLDNNLYIKSSDGKTLEVTTNANTNIVSGQAIARSEMGIKKGTFWSEKGNFLAFYEKDETAVSDYPLLDINAYPGKLKSIKYPMAGQPSELARVGIYSIQKKKAVYIQPRSGTESYLTNVSWSPDESTILIAEVNRDQKHMWLNAYDAKTGKYLRTLFEETKDTWVEPEHPAYFIKEGTEFLWISERDGFDNIYHYSTDGTLIKQLTSNKFVTKSIEWVDKNNVVYFTATGENPLNTLLYSVDLTGDQNLVTQQEGTHTTTIHPDGKFIFDVYSSHDIPNRVQFIQQDGVVIQELFTAKNPLADFSLGKTVIGQLSSKDGQNLYTRTIYPPDFDSTKHYPVLIYVYGGPHAQLITNNWLSGASLWMHWMAAQGYIIFTLDNRGSANRGVGFEHKIHRQLGTLELEDQLTGVQHLTSLPYVDPNRIAVHGWSFGGFMTGTMMMKSPELFKVGVAGGPVTDWKYYEIMYGERYMDTPQQNPEGYKNASLLEHAKNLEGHLLLIHGTHDDVVVMQHNLALIKRFIDLGKQVDFFPYPMHKHNVSGKDRVHLMEKVLHYILEKNY